MRSRDAESISLWFEGARSMRCAIYSSCTTMPRVAEWTSTWECAACKGQRVSGTEWTLSFSASLVFKAILLDVGP